MTTSPDMKEFVGCEGNQTDIEDLGEGLFLINTGTGLMEVTLKITLEDLKYIFCTSGELLRANGVNTDTLPAELKEG